jgi:3-oxoacyl-[acyl-carrier protein] reductase
VDIPVNNAGIAQPKPLKELDYHVDWEPISRLNLTAAFVLTQRVVDNMNGRYWGRIINISSVAAQNGGVIGPHYAACYRQRHRPSAHQNRHGQQQP